MPTKETSYHRDTILEHPSGKKQHILISQYMEFTYSKDHVEKVKAKSCIVGFQTQTFDPKRNIGTPQLPNSRAYPNDKADSQ